MKRWQDKTDEEFKNDIMKMVEEGKLTKWDPWDHIKTLDEAKDYVEAIYDQWWKETKAANDSIVNILESYMEFINIVQFNAKVCNLPEQYQRQLNVLCKRRKKDWEPILFQCKVFQKRKKR